MLCCGYKIERLEWVLFCWCSPCQQHPKLQMIQITALPAFDSNYLWLIHNEHHAWVVDPGDAAVVRQALVERQLSLAGILVTHHHKDHTGGIRELCETFPNVVVVGPARENIAGITLNADDLAENKHCITLESLDVRVDTLSVAGHTAGHVAYFLPAQAALDGIPRLFCGDTLFAAGCGRLFEGTPAQMQRSLASLIVLPPHTLAYCAHEYTLSNLKFAHAVEPNNAATTQRLEQVGAARLLGQATVPFILGEELHTNPFLRCHSTELQDCVTKYYLNSSSKNNPKKLSTEAEFFAALREWKNSF